MYAPVQTHYFWFCAFKPVEVSSAVLHISPVDLPFVIYGMAKVLDDIFISRVSAKLKSFVHYRLFEDLIQAHLLPPVFVSPHFQFLKLALTTILSDLVLLIDF